MSPSDDTRNPSPAPGRSSERSKASGKTARSSEQPAADERRRPPLPDEPTDGEPASPVPIVGIASPAGDTHALRRLLGAMRKDTAVAVVVVPHAAFDRKCLGARSLSRNTELRVRAAKDAMRIKPGHVYVPPANHELRVRGGSFFLQEMVERNGHRMPIDHFFRSLSESAREHAICVVLSGTGSDGAAGLRDVKAVGGLTVVQAPVPPGQDGILSHASAAGLVDYALEIDDIPAVIESHARRLSDAKRGMVALDQTEPKSFASILSTLRRVTTHDFSCYKKATINRRIQRRMGLRQIEDASTYAKLLEAEVGEVNDLLEALLVGVTRFFRDEEAWRELESVVAALVDGRGDESQMLRIWVAGCATGEEAYSLAILFEEARERSGSGVAFTIFATDLNQRAIDVARGGWYPAGIVEDVGPERLEKYFLREHGGYSVARPIRAKTVFATQNLLSDPPFSNLDLLSCRNVMIYLEPSIQERLIEVFHFAVRPGGVLVVGPSDSVKHRETLFEPAGSGRQIFRRVGNPGLPRPALPPMQRYARPQREDADARMSQPSPREISRDMLLEEFAPACALITRRFEVRYLHGAMKRYLDFPQGEPSVDLLDLLTPSLRHKLRAVAQTAFRSGSEASGTAAHVRLEDELVRVRIRVLPGPGEGGSQLFLACFEPESDPDSKSQVETQGDDGQSFSAGNLEYELSLVREDLQSTIQELATSNEDLRASNEEVTSMNEELQSTNEELETSKEELQTLNEELNAVNAQLQENVAELAGANDDLSNLLTSTEIATVFLDTDLKIRRFTPKMGELLNVIEADVGRPFSDLSLRVDDPLLIDDARSVLLKGRPIQREVQAGGPRFFLRRVSLYRTARDRNEGVFVTFTDVTELHEANARAERRERQAALVAEVGRRALAGLRIPDLARLVARQVALGLDLELTKVLEVLPSGRLLVRAGVGWRRGIVGRILVDGGSGTQADFALQAGKPVIVEDLATETRFRGPRILIEHDVVSGLSVQIGSPDDPWGVLGAHSRSRRDFTVDDVHFVEAVANVFADAVSRSRAEERLILRARQMSLMYQAAVSASSSLEEALQSCVDAVCEVIRCPIGHAFVPSRDGRMMVSSGIWHVENEAATKKLRLLTESASFRPGEGFIGTVWAARAPRQVLDMNEEPVFVMERFGKDNKLRGAFAFPVIVEGEVAAILEFYSPEPIHPDSTPLEVIGTLGEQLGHVYERNRDAKKLNVLAGRLTHALEAAGVGAFEWDFAMGQVSWSEEFCRMLGYDAGIPASHERWLARVHPVDRDRVESMLLEVERDARPYTCEYRLLLPGGQVRWVEGRGRLLADPRRMYGILTDITERRRLENDLREADRRKDAFLSTLGHELRNPLGAVSNGLQYLILEEQIPDERRTMLSMIARQVHLMSSLLNDLLDIGRIARGGLSLEFQTVSIEEQLEQAIETAGGIIGTHGHEIHVRVDPPDLAVRADAVRLNQILVNLIGNAARYTPAPGRIDIEAVRDGNRARITVSDDGVGLTADEIEDIFEPFYQVRKGSGGLGIGLALVRRLAEMHGGQVTATSAGHGHGASFVLSIPASDAERAGVPEKRDATEGGDGLRNLRVLVVDDHRDSLTALSALLSRQCRLETAETGEEAIEKARLNLPDVALIDLALPGMSGFEVCGAIHELAEKRGKPPVCIAMTGFGDVQTEIDIADAGFAEHLLKPIDFASLIGLLRSAADGVLG